MKYCLWVVKNSTDRIFATDLLRKTIINKIEYQKTIEESIANWDLDRLASIDLLILQIALTELLNFEEIPIKVTLNEYIDYLIGRMIDKVEELGIADNTILQKIQG